MSWTNILTRRNKNKNKNKNKNTNNGFSSTKSPMKNYSAVLNKTRNNALARRRNAQTQFFRNRKLKENEYVERRSIHSNEKLNRSPVNQKFFDLTLYQRGPLNDVQVRELGIIRSLVKDLQTGRLTLEDIQELKRLAKFSASEKDPKKLAAVSDRIKTVLTGTHLLGLLGTTSGALLIVVGAIMSSGILFAIGPAVLAGGYTTMILVNRYKDHYIGHPSNLNHTQEEVETVQITADELLPAIDKLLIQQPMSLSSGLQIPRNTNNTGIRYKPNKKSFEPVPKNQSLNIE